MSRYYARCLRRDFGTSHRDGFAEICHEIALSCSRNVGLATLPMSWSHSHPRVSSAKSMSDRFRSGIITRYKCFRDFLDPFALVLAQTAHATETRRKKQTCSYPGHKNHFIRKRRLNQSETNILFKCATKSQHIVHFSLLLLRPVILSFTQKFHPTYASICGICT